MLRYERSSSTSLELAKTLVASHHSLRLSLYVVDNTEHRQRQGARVDRKFRSLKRVFAADKRVVSFSVLNGRGNIGFRAGHNLAVKQAATDGCQFVLMLNDDGLLRIDTVQTLHAALVESPNAAAASPAVLFGEEYSDLERTSGPLSRKAVRHIQSFVDRELASGLLYRYNDSNSVFRKVIFPLECCVLIKLDTALAESILRPEPFIYLEGWELGANLFASKLDVLFCPSAVYFHPRDLFDYRRNVFKHALIWRAYFSVVFSHFDEAHLGYFEPYLRPESEFNALQSDANVHFLFEMLAKSRWGTLVILKGMIDGMLGRTSDPGSPRAPSAEEPALFWRQVICGETYNKSGYGMLLENHDAQLVTWLLVSAAYGKVVIIPTKDTGLFSQEDTVLIAAVARTAKEILTSIIRIASVRPGATCSEEKRIAQLQANLVDGVRLWSQACREKCSNRLSESFQLEEVNC